jgi:hypothetical protein
MANIKDSLKAVMEIDGAAGAALIDLKNGMSLGLAGDMPNLDIEAAVNADILKASVKALQTLGKRDSVEDIVISLGQRYQIIRVVGGQQHLMFYLSLHRTVANLALARLRLAAIEQDLVV